MEKDIYHTNNNQNKKTGVAILISDTTDIKKNCYQKQKRTFYNKGPIKNYTRIIYNPNNGLYEENVTELKKRNQKNTQKQLKNFILHFQ